MNMDVVSVLESETQGIQGDLLGREDINVLMSLPTCLIQFILGDWVDVISVIRLDSALCGNSRFGQQFVDLLKYVQFCVKEVKQTESISVGERNSQQPQFYSRVLNWLLRREAKIVDLEVYENCSALVLEGYLQQFGSHVRCLTLYAPAHISLTAQYCPNLTTLSINSYEKHIDSVLFPDSNPGSDTFQISGSRGTLHDPLEPPPTMHHLKQVKWFSVDDKYDNQLALLAKAAPNLQQLTIFGKRRFGTMAASGVLMMDVARACPHVRSFSCGRLHVGNNDVHLKPFFSVCSDVIHVNLSMHDELTDTVLIEALSELKSLHCLNLRGCSRLTDRTLQFLAQRFASTLKLLYLGYSRVVEQGGYTTAGIASLRAQCTKLHTFHFSLQVHVRVPALPMVAYECATIVDISSEEMIPMILANCRQIRILAITSYYFTSTRKMVWLSVEQLMAIAACCPQLHTVITEKNKYGRDECKVDYTAVKKAYPLLVFTEDRSTLDFDVLKMSV